MWQCPWHHVGVVMKTMLKITRLVGCAALTVPAAGQEPGDKERTIAAIEAAGCQLDPSNTEAVVGKLGLSREAFRAIGRELVAEGKADVSTFGVFKLTTEACQKPVD